MPGVCFCRADATAATRREEELSRWREGRQSIRRSGADAIAAVDITERKKKSYHNGLKAGSVDGLCDGIDTEYNETSYEGRTGEAGRDDSLQDEVQQPQPQAFISRCRRRDEAGADAADDERPEVLRIPCGSRAERSEKVQETS